MPTSHHRLARLPPDLLFMPTSCGWADPALHQARAFGHRRTMLAAGAAHCTGSTSACALGLVKDTWRYITVTLLSRACTVCTRSVRVHMHIYNREEQQTRLGTFIIEIKQQTRLGTFRIEIKQQTRLGDFARTLCPPHTLPWTWWWLDISYAAAALRTSSSSSRGRGQRDR